MQFGIFDHVDRNDRPLAQQLDERIRYIALAEELGFYCYHVAEHHASPINMVPVPGLFLAAAARATKRIRLGPLVYLLTLYSPLRLIEEVALLDHLSHGRFEFGVGRGVSPFELNYHNVSYDDSRAIFQEALAAVLEGLTHERLNHEGRYFTYKDVPMELRPLQFPHPPVWYAASNADSSRWAGERGYHFATLGSVKTALANITAFKEGLAKVKTISNPKPEFPGGAAIGVHRQLFVADTDEEAVRRGAIFREQHHKSLTKLRRENKEYPGFTRSTPDTFEDAIKQRNIIYGSSKTVREELARQIDELGINYFIGSFMFGNMQPEDAARSLRLFASEVMPGFQK
ncbi:MAG TPA: LLM class flavin-dependent oxidoreductase [Stellaceae bacterium]|jgi:alkanesulfonate monooxygenase SsuD/methylene tetrahydromethanopterin reductase-like flavin-dependent oxidoreductase (luciferase family)|nr:LLM class flavin-dependent oxidoreductase [Stellaceae bacterium]